MIPHHLRKESGKRGMIRLNTSLVVPFCLRFLELVELRRGIKRDAWDDSKYSIARKFR